MWGWMGGTHIYMKRGWQRPSLASNSVYTAGKPWCKPLIMVYSFFHHLKDENVYFKNLPGAALVPLGIFFI